MYKDRDWLYQRVALESKCDSDIARELDCSRYIIAKWRKELKVLPLYNDKDFLHQRLNIENKTYLQVADEIKCSASVIGKWARKLDVVETLVVKVSISERFPNLLKIWDFERNEEDGIYPENTLHTSEKDVHWICSKNPKHRFVESPANVLRRKEQCSICLGKIATAENCIATIYPFLIELWDTERNESSIHHITEYSYNGKNFNWLCKNGHSFNKKLSDMIRSAHCFECTSLLFSRPDLLDEWDYEKNTVCPSKVAVNSHQHFYWTCRKCSWSFPSTTANRNRITEGGKTHCPNCNGKVLRPELTLAHLHPDVAKRWDYAKNEDTPLDVFANSGKRRWWVCEKGHGYDSIISNQSKGRTCPECDKGRKTSFAEQAIYHYIKTVFNDAMNRSPFVYEEFVSEFDVYIPSIRLAIEYDGVWFHSTERVKEIDKRKSKSAKMDNINLIRVREKGLEEDSLCENILNVDPHRRNLDKSISNLLSLISVKYSHLLTELQVSQLKDVLVNTNEIRSEIHSNLIIKEIESSLQETHPQISSEWHPTLNGEFKPIHVSYGSNKKVEWLCEKDHSYPAIIADRTMQNHGCPFCSGRQLTHENSLKSVCPDLAKEWHPTKNGDLTPSDVPKSGSKKVWWIVNGKEKYITINSRYEQWKKNNKQTQNRMEND